MWACDTWFLHKVPFLLGERQRKPVTEEHVREAEKQASVTMCSDLEHLKSLLQTQCSGDQE